jgi:hypothetical protein
MRIRGLTLWLCLLSGLSACDSSRGGAMTVSWTFSGGSCSGAAVQQIRIAIAGEPLSQDTFDCLSGVATFTDFYPGNYVVTVQGLDADQAVTWTGSKSVRLDGDVSVTVDLQPVSQQNAVAYLSWTFAPATGQAPQCGTGQRLDSVAIYVDGAATNLGYACGDGLGTNQVVTPYLAPGDHSVQLVAYNAVENQTAFAQTDPVTIHFETGRAVSQALTMKWQVGGLAMSWGAYPSLAAYQSNPNQPLACASTGIATVSVFLADPANPNSGTQFDGYTCASGALLDNAPPGQWLPFVAGYDAGGQNVLFFQDDQNVPQTVTVVAGRFYSPQDTQTQVFVPLFP